MKAFRTRGYSLLEMIIYIAILALLLVVIISLTISITVSARGIKASKLVENSGIFALERIVRETRLASTVNGTSVFGTNPGTLSLTTGTTTRTVDFYVSSGQIYVRENGVVQGALTEASTTVTNLTFNLITSSSSQAVKTTITIQSGSGSTLKQKSFYATTILRESYAN